MERTDIGSRIAAYSMFCLDRSRLLGRILRPASISQLPLTPEYFAIIGLTSISLAAPELIAFELERCQERLEAARVDVAGERRRWREAFTIVVCDTNVFVQAVAEVRAGNYSAAGALARLDVGCRCATRVSSATTRQRIKQCVPMTTGRALVGREIFHSPSTVLT